MSAEAVLGYSNFSDCNIAAFLHPGKVYRTTVSMAQEKNSKILKKDDDELHLEAADVKQIGTFKAVATASD